MTSRITDKNTSAKPRTETASPASLHVSASAEANLSQPSAMQPHNLLQLQSKIGNRAVTQLLRSGAGSKRSEPIQRERNQTGLPDQLKTGVESLSGLAMDDVKVHYNSSKPSEVNALAYAQGTDIHIGPGQERHLPHEAWHVAQQKQGRVKPTVQLKDASINDDAGLEHEADVMGMKANQAAGGPEQLEQSSAASTSIQMKADAPMQFIGGDVLKFIQKAWRGPEGEVSEWYSQIAMILKNTRFEGRAEEVFQYYKENPGLARPRPTDEASSSSSSSSSSGSGSSMENEEKESRSDDVSVPENRPTSGGMVEGDAATIADLNEWEEDTAEYDCTDRAHSPKGKVYYDSRTKRYYGADNTGHVGWGFKIWVKKDKTTLIYKGNLIWSGTEWVENARGTK
ncbi:eCIS core domain-containing protein [Paenibacillus sp. FJAT-27812]|uniref:eCIS core domain-containing protein n=1 Tax=Paenibacillus sp. FJAT-27812 TaxID=1684143 RepID=UPI0018D0AEFE|nr:DUF4157 domain-containing protein [Paenibacillus sp. FJAT-27812]